MWGWHSAWHHRHSLGQGVERIFHNKPPMLMPDTSQLAAGPNSPFSTTQGQDIMPLLSYAGGISVLHEDANGKHSEGRKRCQRSPGSTAWPQAAARLPSPSHMPQHFHLDIVHLMRYCLCRSSGRTIRVLSTTDHSSKGICQSLWRSVAQMPERWILNALLTVQGKCR